MRYLVRHSQHLKALLTNLYIQCMNGHKMVCVHVCFSLNTTVLADTHQALS